MPDVTITSLPGDRQEKLFDMGDGSFARAVQVATRPAYSGGIAGLVPATLATDIFLIFGSATKVTFVKRIVIKGTATAATVADFLLIRRSTANSGGTSTAPTLVRHDSTDPAPTSGLAAYTANPTPGTTVGTLRAEKVLLPTVGGIGEEIIWDFAVRRNKAPILRSAAEGLAINMNGVTVAGANLDIYVELEEGT